MHTSCFVSRPVQDSRKTQEQQQRAATVWNLRRLLREATGEQVSEDVVRALTFAAAHATDVQHAFVAWIDLIETLVRHEERIHGSTPKMGPIKSTAIKSIVGYLLRHERLRFPQVPDAFRPLVVDLLAPWSADAVVLMFNHYGLWEQIDGAQESRRSLRGRVWIRIVRSIDRLTDLVSRLPVSLWTSVRTHAELSPEIEAALAAVEREGFPEFPTVLIKGDQQAAMWFSGCRMQVLSLAELVFAAVQEAESLTTLSGVQRKAHAVDLVFATLADMGFHEQSGVSNVILRAIVELVVDASVHVFNKRRAFSHRAAFVTNDRRPSQM